MTDIHEAAIVDVAARIGKNVKIGPYSIIGPDVKIDDNVTIKSHVVIEGRTSIGSGTIVYPFASLGQAPQDLKYAGEKAELIIGSNNIIREHVTMNIGTSGDLMKTVVGDNCLFMMSSHVAHDCIVGNNVILANNATLGGHVKVGNFVILGGLSAVHQFVHIGDHVMVGGLSGIGKDVPPYSLVVPEYPSLSGINIVGLKRSGLVHNDTKIIKEAYELLFNGSGNLADSILNVEKKFGDNPHILKIIDFFKNASSRGITTPKNYYGKTE